MRHILCGIVACFLSLNTFGAGPASEHQKSVGGITINIGVVPAAQAALRAGEQVQPAAEYASGAQHLVVSLSDAKTGNRVGDAQVVVEVKDPKGNTEKKALVSAVTAGVPDYSGVFRFNWSGKYAIRVNVTPKDGKKALAARFTWTHVI